MGIESDSALLGLGENLLGTRPSSKRKSLSPAMTVHGYLYSIRTEYWYDVRVLQMAIASMTATGCMFAILLIFTYVRRENPLYPLITALWTINNGNYILLAGLDL